jgi:SAM-dependent methyltransferase
MVDGERLLKQTTCGGSIVPKSDFFDLPGDHVQRYVWARNFIRGLKVIDVGCGYGYGTHYLAEATKFVVGVDSDPKAINFALRSYARQNLEFRLIDVYDLQSLDESFDAAVSFEVIEHLKQPRAYLRNVAEALANDAMFYVSTPNKKYTERFYVNGRSPNKGHLTEYCPEEMRRLLNEFFSIESMFYEVSTTGLEAILESRIEARERYQKSFFIPRPLRKFIPDSVKQTWLHFSGFGPEYVFDSVLDGKWKDYIIRETTMAELDTRFPVQIYCCRKVT